MPKQELEVNNRIEKSAAQSGSNDNIDRLQLLKEGTTGSGASKIAADNAGQAAGGRDSAPGGNGGFLEMTDPFKQGTGEGSGQSSSEKDNQKKPEAAGSSNARAADAKQEESGGELHPIKKDLPPAGQAAPQTHKSLSF